MPAVDTAEAVSVTRGLDQHPSSAYESVRYDRSMPQLVPALQHLGSSGGGSPDGRPRQLHQPLGTDASL